MAEKSSFAPEVTPPQTFAVASLCVHVCMHVGVCALACVSVHGQCVRVNSVLMKCLRATPGAGPHFPSCLEPASLCSLTEYAGLRVPRDSVSTPNIGFTDTF